MATVHVVGAGLAGLAAAERLVSAGAEVVLWEAAPQAGGRCRSYYDDALGLTIDNGNHLLLSANVEALDYVRCIGGCDALTIAEEAAFPFVDLASGERWTLRPSQGRLPRWLLDPSRRVPGTRPWHYLAPLGLVAAGRRTTVTDRLAVHGRLYERLWRPVLLAALNTDPAEASARLAARLMAQTLGRGGGACRPIIATGGLGAAFVDPALAFLTRHGASVRLSSPVRALSQSALSVAGETVPLGPDDRIVLAVPPWTARTLIPGLTVPDAFRPILNIHFAVEAPGLPPLTGLVGGSSEWLFAFPDHLSVTISAADALAAVPREKLAAEVWGEVRAATRLTGDLPRWQVIAERRATFAATPEQLAKRPKPTATGLPNVVLAGDWTDTGLPATIEGAVWSGRRAAGLVRSGLVPTASTALDRAA